MAVAAGFTGGPGPGGFGGTYWDQIQAQQAQAAQQQQQNAAPPQAQQQAAPQAQQGSGTNPAFPNLPPDGGGKILSAGQQNPFHTDASPILGSPGLPDNAASNSFLPSVFRDPYLQGLNAATQTSNFSSQALPAAGQFQQSLYSPGITPMEQTYLQSAAQLSNNQLSNTQSNIAGMFENSGMSSGLAPALLQAANTSGAQLGQLAGQMGTQRQQMATNALPFTMGFPIQAAQAAQQSSQGLFGQAQQAMFGDLSFPLAQQGSNAFASPTIISQPGASGGSGKGK